MNEQTNKERDGESQLLFCSEGPEARFQVEQAGPLAVPQPPGA